MLNTNPVLSPANPHTQALTKDLTKHLRDIAREHNLGAMWDAEATAAPTTGSWSQGQMCRNTAPAEAGTSGSKYVIIGWVCVTSGTPGTWLSMRTLTGN